MALNPNIVVVAPNDLITSAHLNNVRANIVRLDTDKADWAGGTFSGTTYWFGNPGSSQLGVAISAAVGTLSSTLGAGVATSQPNASWNRNGTGAGAPGAVGGVFERFMLNNATQIGSVTVASATGVAFNVTSDRRLKDIVGPVADALARVRAMQPRRLAWKDGGQQFDGFIADEVQAVVPEAVTGEPDAMRPAGTYNEDDPGGIDPQQLNMSALVPLLAAAVIELADRLEQALT